MYISVIPTSHTLNTEPLVYYTKEDFAEQISIGSLVEVPIGKITVPAIVSERDIPLPENIPIENIRAILHVISSTPLLSEESIHIIRGLARKMLIQIHKVLLLFLPKSTLTALEKKSFIKISSTKPPVHRNRERSIEFFHTTRVTAKEIEKYLIKRTIIVVPDDILLRTMERYFHGKDYGFFRGDATPSERIKSWISVKNGEKEICFGTRRLLYYNLENYEQILYVEDAFAREYYQHPQSYRHIDSLVLYKEHSDISLRILTSIPTIETLSLLKDFPIHNITHTDIA